MIEETTIEVEGLPVFVRRKPGPGVPSLLVHGNPAHSEEWLPFLNRIEGPALALDLPGWGRTPRLGARRVDATMDGLAAFMQRFIEAADLDRYKLALHDWGAVALIAAQRDPERVERLVLVDAVPLLPGYRWHWVARMWRRRGVGELFNATTTRSGTALLLRRASGDRGPMPRQFVDMIWRHYDRGTRRAVLALYRSADEPLLAEAGAELGKLACPALVVWGTRDPYIPSRFGRLYAERLPRAELIELPDAGHWPWIDRPELVQRVTGFLDGG